MERTGGIDPKCTLHIPSDFCPVKTIAVAAFSSSPNDLNKHHFSECRRKDTNSDILKSADSIEAVKASDITSQGEQMLQLADSSELDIVDTVNARKSLAWDSAFFDSAGILDEEELSNMIDGVCRNRQNCMPVNNKNVHRSYDTISSLERIEAELFTDIRASTQKFVKEPNLGNFSGKTAVEDRGTKIANSSKKTDTISRDRPKSILKKESESQQTKRLGSRHVSTVQTVASIHRVPITTGRTNPISTPSRSVSNANLSRLDPKKSKDTGKLGVSTKPVLISRSDSVSSSPLIKKTSSASGNVTNSIDAGRKASSTTVNQQRNPSNIITKRHIDLKSYMMLTTKLSPTKSSASSISDTSSESYLSTPALNNKINRRSNESSNSKATTSPRSYKGVVQSKVGRSLNFMSKSNDRLLGSVRSLTKAITSQDLKKGEPNKAKSVNLSSSSNSVGARVSSVNRGSSPQITKGRVGTGAIKGSDSRWM
ncbi:uncharacterized protein LOC124943094 [Impatiens glandulifera]|uniref:uncharacterized protein LOC124943094 n=1 Tax=Impatiens glandulifera TaxID=253017 RepID=UPI001FB07EC9|nr:uncharacterized protein LOC124943094 [Impatiens glandulifera]